MLNTSVSGYPVKNWSCISWSCLTSSKKETEIFSSVITNPTLPITETQRDPSILRSDVNVIVPILHDVYPSSHRQIALVVLDVLAFYTQDTLDNVTQFYWKGNPGLIHLKGVDFDYFLGLYHENVVTSDLVPHISKESLKAGAHGTIRSLALMNTSKEEAAVVALKMPIHRSKEGKRRLKLEALSTEGVSQIKGAIQMEGRLFSDKLSLRGLVLEKFPNDMFDYMEILRKRQEESQENTRDIKPLVSVFGFLIDFLDEMDECDKVHNDIKLENIVVDYDFETLEIKKMALIDFANTDPNDPVFIVSPFCTFPREYQLVDEILSGVEHEGVNLVEMRKLLDRRQVAFCIYEMLATVLGGHNEPYPMREIQLDGKVTVYPNPEGPYRDLPEGAGTLLSSLIKDMLDPDINKVPSRKEVLERFSEINLDFQNKRIKLSD